jgi:hypothetical protein
MSMALICPIVSIYSALLVINTHILSEERARSHGHLHLAIPAMLLG